jgi:MoxR-like ATPase
VSDNDGRGAGDAGARYSREAREAVVRDPGGDAARVAGAPVHDAPGHDAGRAADAARMVDAARAAEVERLAELGGKVVDEIGRVVVGKKSVVELILLALLSDGHVLIEDLPGLAKTLMARSFAQVVGLRFARIQFTPDLMPSDVTGAGIYDQRSGDFTFRPGPVFTNLLLGDEINRAPAKTQAALLEAMQERQVTVEGTTRQLEPPFLVIATQNPIEAEGTYPLPEAQLDRFLIRISVGHPERDHEIEMLQRRADRRSDDLELDEVIDADTLRWMQHVTEDVFVSPSISAYIVDLVAATRSSSLVQVGASPRGSLALFKLARSRAAMAGRDFVIPEDIKAVAVPALAHRIMLKPEVWVQRIRTEDLVRRVLDSVPTPPAEDAAAVRDSVRNSLRNPASR